MSPQQQVLVVGEPTPAAVKVLLLWRRVLRLQGRDMLQTSWAPLPVEVRGVGGWDRAPLPHFSPPMEAAGRGKRSWARTGKQYPEVHSAGLWREVSPGVQALSRGRLSSSPPWRFPLAPAPSGHHHPKHLSRETARTTQPSKRSN